SGASGFSGFETAFAAVFTELVRRDIHNDSNKAPDNTIGLKQLSSLISARPARLLGLGSGPRKRGRIVPGYRADMVIVDTESSWKVNPENFITRGKNSPFVGKELYGRILMTLHEGRVVFDR
ncbi:MAG: amidohydrolase family protein, partial [Treponema sp.]|nr:amidohydrolase family protein [Treponema sp.]